MDAIADALVYAVTYINLRADEDADVDALESIAAYLGNVTVAEQNALAAAAERALAAEKANNRPRKDFIRDYSKWMEEMFCEGWEGNHRIQE